MVLSVSQLAAATNNVFQQSKETLAAANANVVNTPQVRMSFVVISELQRLPVDGRRRSAEKTMRNLSCDTDM